MKKHPPLHFGGLWALMAEPAPNQLARTAIHFFGENYLVFLDYEKPNNIAQGIFDYQLTADELRYQWLGGEKPENNPVITIKWRMVDERFLELTESSGHKSLWEPVLAEQLIEEGYPAIVFESLRSSFSDLGALYSVDALAPDPSAFEVLKKGDRRNT